MTIASESLIATNIYHKDLRKAIQPLEPYFGIQQFCYFVLFADGSSVHINTDVGITEYFADNNLYAVNPHQVSPDNLGAGIVPWKVDDGYSDVVDLMAQDFDLAHGITCVEKFDDRCELFTFSAPQASKKAQLRMQNDSQYLLKFIDHLKKEQAAIFEKTKAEYRFNLAEIKDDYYTQQGVIPNEPDDRKDLVKLLVKIGLVDPKVGNVRLAAQERRCVSLIIQGKSAKQVAKELNLSPRTVESYLTNIRQKLGIYFTRDLFDLKDSLLELGMLD